MLISLGNGIENYNRIKLIIIFSMWEQREVAVEESELKVDSLA